MIAVSTVLLLLLCAVFLRGAARAWRRWRDGDPLPKPRMLDSSRGGYLLGLTMALSSPWNVAFWIAVVGNTRSTDALDAASSLLLAGCVVLAACTWGLVLCTAVRLGARFATPLWDVITQAATAALMLVFAARGVARALSP